MVDRTLDLSVDIAPTRPGGFRLRNPVLVASGTFGYGTEYAGLVDIGALGAIVSKAITLRPRAGNPQPRIVETPAGMLNAIGLQNIGVQAVIHEKAPIWAKWQTPVIANIAGFSVDEYAELAGRLDAVAGVAAIELNISCPNVASEGESFGLRCDTAAAATSAARTATDLPLIVKLSPNVTSIADVAEAVVGAGADAVSLINTIPGMVVDLRTRRPYLANRTGGLSGPAIRPIAVRMVYEVAQRVRVPIIGIGGIASAEDALQFLLAGATAVQIGTATFVDPHTATRVAAGIRDYLAGAGLTSVRDIIGAALPAQPAQA